ncbi:uncharacterized protein LOC117343593 [Pecten maximus]|uniref:uncharacterized protein LOC117343593 n=1 Tax=Pecten maximus TaxID=6579 RepID=UPI001458E429|nr:uncharacterized protein LOC117343593 [Pecten maximus]XP_033761916.1 uncharacterized protein LOC117343593 [Pecten maximus]
MADNNSLSVKLRKEGNDVYTSVRDGLCVSIKFSRFSSAADSYRRAFDAAKGDEESVPAAKNAAMTFWRIAETETEMDTKPDRVARNYKEAFKYFSYAYRHGISCKPSDWITKLLSSIDECWSEFSFFMNEHASLEDRIDHYYNVLETVEIDYIRGNFYLNLARFHFRSGVTAIQNGRYQRGLSEMRNCSMPIHEARKHCLDVNNVGLECNILEDDVIMHQCTADAMQAIDVGDKLFRKIMKDEENINMDIVWDVVDWYKSAVLRTRERTEMEQEAIATSRLGKLYDKVLKMKDKAHEYVMKSVQLAHSMHPRTFTSEDWFKEASKILKKYQDEKAAEEDKEWKKQREEVKKKMTEQLESLYKAEKKGDLELLEYLYKNFPPKNPLHKEVFVMPTDPKELKELDLEKKKKLYQHAVVNYHPDRANVKEHGTQWKVLTEEITKILNCRYNRQKAL